MSVRPVESLSTAIETAGWAAVDQHPAGAVALPITRRPQHPVQLGVGSSRVVGELDRVDAQHGVHRRVVEPGRPVARSPTTNSATTSTAAAEAVACRTASAEKSTPTSLDDVRPAISRP